MWQITGGTGDFTELGQTWSQPVPGTINIDGTDVDVLFFSGGYDPDQDDTDLRAVDDLGRAIYIVNAETGALIWSGGWNGGSFIRTFAEMTYSIPASLAVVDIDSNGQDDMIFVGDLGGQLWRFDINNGAAVENLVDGGVIADLGVAQGVNTAADNRRFYHTPDVALTRYQGEPSLAVTIGSGYRAHPLSTKHTDRFYMIRQSAVFGTPASYETVGEGDLYDATDNEVGEGVSEAKDALDAAKGWYITLPNTGEKVLSTPLTFADRVTFTTYEPSPSSTSNKCIPSAGTSRVYQVMLGDASPVNNWDNITGLTEDDRGRELKTGSIVDEPVIICTDTSCQMFVGAEKPAVSAPNVDRVVKTFWRKDQ
jgi:type IV pilus assembly protein PilY1